MSNNIHFVIFAFLGTAYLIGGILILKKGFRKGGIKEYRRIRRKIRDIRDKDVKVSLPVGGEVQMESLTELELEASKIYTFITLGLLLLVIGGITLAASVKALFFP